ncbi:MAG: alpha-2-macroglobulin family protein [Ferruginibacter sp.]
MKNISRILLPLFLIFNSIAVCAQNNDYTAEWKKVAGFENKGLTKDALTEVIRIFDAAVKTGNEPQQIKAAMYQMKYRNMVEEDNKENNIFFLDTLIAKTKAPAKNILLSMKAELMESYRQNNRWKFYDRSPLTQELSNDINTWSIEKLVNTTADLYKASLQNEALLKSTRLDGLDAILTKGINTRQLRPTLYDFLGHRALLFFMDQENDVIQPAYKFIMNDERIFAPVKEFVNAGFPTADTSSQYYNALVLLQKILKFHISDGNTDALLDADLIRLQFANEHGIFTNKETLYENALLAIEKNYSTGDHAATAMVMRAELYNERGSRYHPFNHKDNQFDIVKAKELLEQVIARYPKSVAAINSKNMLQTIKQPSLNLQTEKVNIPNEPFRTLVSYKNTPAIYLRAIKVNRTDIRDLEIKGEDVLWNALVKMKPVKEWNVSLPDLKDMQEHSTEIKMDGLPVGTYLVLASISRDFSLKNNIIAKQTTYISNISYIYNNEKEIYVLHRSSGEPLAKATVTVWEDRYDYGSRKYLLTKREVFTTDKNGFAKLVIPANRYNNNFQITTANDELFSADSYSNYNYNSYEKKAVKRTFLFTDRSIYRPGQTVYFKGIVVSTDASGRKSDILPGFKTSMSLYNANGEKVTSLAVTSNEYGSFNGNFKLPEGLLNGQFYIMDETNQNQQYFNVEEYKRPKFLVEIKKPEGSYRINEFIKVTGNAKAYAGNNVDGATVVYRVVRRVQYPIWWGWGRKIWPPYGGKEEMEITNGTTKTDTDGNFTVNFKAIPDETVDKKDQPTFYYDVIADITDINGETRSGETTVAVAYQALQLDIAAADKLPADSIKNIRINSTNLNGLFEKATVTFSLYKLQEPGRMFRNRYWKQPDQFVMSREEYYRLFPYDVYADENEVSKWATGAKVLEITDTTAAGGAFALGQKAVAAGWYKIVVTTTDKYGEAVKAEKLVRLTDKKENKIDDPFLFSADKRSAEPGEKLSYSLQTGFDKIWLIQSLSRTGKERSMQYNEVTSGKPYSNTITATEEDRGGINLSYVFVKNNRVYTGTDNLSVPWSNKDLTISYSTFRDKLLPGAEEKWTMKVSGSKGQKLAAEMLVSMYDASLDQFKAHSWNDLKFIWPANSNGIYWTYNTFQLLQSNELNRYAYDYLSVPEKSYDMLADYGWNDGYGGTYRYYFKSAARGVLREEVSMNVAEAPAAMADSEQDSSPKHMKLPKPVNDDTDGDGIVDQVDKNTGGNNKSKSNSGGEVQIRKNFNETAFFFPALATDADGNVSFSFTMPEALTQWKLMTLGHTKELASGYSEQTVITQKPLMVQPNAPRFIREGDDMELVAKIVNMSDKEITGTAQLELIDAATGKGVDGWFKNVFPNQYFTVEAGKSVAVKFPMGAPYNFNSALTYRIKAISKDGSFSDGEEMAIPVLTNRMLVTETLPLNMRNTGSKTFLFEKLLQSGSSNTLSHQSFTIEYTSNPAWYAVQALPYLMEYPYECAEQTFNRYYANTLASYVANSTPKIKAVFEKWKTADTAALMSNLQKNEELKSALLQETPWVLQAKTEAEQKKNIAVLFDMVRLAKEKQSTFNKLKEMQSSNGGFTWFKGGPDDRFITQYIVTGIGHLKKLNALSAEDNKSLDEITTLALPYLDARLKEEYDELLKYKVKLADNHLSYTAIQYLYMRSFFTGKPVQSSAVTAYNYYKGQSQKYWLSQSKYMQGMIALALYRTNDAKTPKAITASLKQNAITSEEMGMYWKEFTSGGYYWYQAPVESQALMVEVFSDIDKDNKTTDDIKTWLLKQKQVQNWKTTKATAEAVYALLLNGSNWLSEEKTVTIQAGSTVISSSTQPVEAGTGYFKQTFSSEKVKPEMGTIKVTVSNAAANSSSTSWGAAYWQYFEDLDKISSAATPLQLKKKIFVEQASDRGPVLREITEGETLKVGDKVKVRIELKVDRDMEYVHMKDMRAATMEPVNVLSQYKWQGGLGYYESTKDASTNFFFSWLPRGSYVFEYPLFVSQVGNFSNGITTIQSMYAPEFSSHSEGVRVRVEN